MKSAQGKVQPGNLKVNDKINSYGGVMIFCQVVASKVFLSHGTHGYRDSGCVLYAWNGHLGGYGSLG